MRVLPHQPTHFSSIIPLHWGQGPPLPLMPDTAILGYICCWSHGSLHVYFLVGGLVPGSSGDLVGWYCFSMGLQNPSAPTVLVLRTPLGSLCSVQLAASIHICISKALAEPLRRQLYQVPVSKLLLASTIVSGFDDWIWDGNLWRVILSVSAPHFVSVTPSMVVLFPTSKKD